MAIPYFLRCYLNARRGGRPVPLAHLPYFVRCLKKIKEDGRGFTVVPEYRKEEQIHPIKNIDLECEFASEQIFKYDPGRILDIGSYRLWLIGVMSQKRVTTVDIRYRESGLFNESVITADIAKGNLELEQTYDMVVSLSTIEHIGLSRYGDDFDATGDMKALKNILSLICSGGLFVFTVPVTAGIPCVAFNSHRIYSVDMIRKGLENLSLVEEKFIKMDSGRFRYCTASELVTEVGKYDVYCGCYRK